jgi:hypothetical protein
MLLELIVVALIAAFSSHIHNTIFYCEMELEWAAEEYTVCCTRNERSGLARFKTGIWKLRGIMKGFEKGRCPLCREEEDSVRIQVFQKRCIHIIIRNINLVCMHLFGTLCIIKIFGNEEVEGTNVECRMAYCKLRDIL